MEIPVSKVSPGNGLLFHDGTPRVAPADVKPIVIPRTGTFTLVVALSIDHDAFFGEIIRTDAFTYGIEPGELPRPYIKVGDEKAKSSNVLGNSDVWKTANRGTGALVSSREAGRISTGHHLRRRCIEDLHRCHFVDQYITVRGLSLSEVIATNFKGTLAASQIYDRVLLQDEIKALK